MTKRILIEATHPEETRIVVLKDSKVDEFEFETAAIKQLRGNIYLAKITRIEPSLQAAFVDYGGNRNGFLPFSEIHPDYFRIPQSDRDRNDSDDDEDTDDTPTMDDVESFLPGEDDVDTDEGENETEADESDSNRVSRRKYVKSIPYKIQEVIKKRQIVLVQVVKEERGTKGAALTTYLSLAGRYCVLMPNSSNSGGVSRKINDIDDRKRLRKVLEDLEIPDGMSLIIRTAGMERNRTELKKDSEYLLKTWEGLRQKTLESTAPSLIHQEGDLVKRTIRDIYSKDVEEILVEGEEGYKLCRDFVKVLIPSHVRKVKPYKEPLLPLFRKFNVEEQLSELYSTQVRLRSGGSIVINQTEALVAIDINSGQSTRERHIEETAYQTNLEAAEEIARQLRFRDLGGLIVVDFIDMEDSRHIRTVEQRFREALKQDRARIQLGSISQFGLLELSRQRLRPSMLELSTQKCPKCHGSGFSRSLEATALDVLRCIEDEGFRGHRGPLRVYLPGSVALYLLNNKRKMIEDIESRHELRVEFHSEEHLPFPEFRIESSIPKPLPAHTDRKNNRRDRSRDKSPSSDQTHQQRQKPSGPKGIGAKNKPHDRSRNVNQEQSLSHDLPVETEDGVVVSQTQPNELADRDNADNVQGNHDRHPRNRGRNRHRNRRRNPMNKDGMNTTSGNYQRHTNHRSQSGNASNRPIHEGSAFEFVSAGMDSPTGNKPHHRSPRRNQRFGPNDNRFSSGLYGNDSFSGKQQFVGLPKDEDFDDDAHVQPAPAKQKTERQPTENKTKLDNVFPMTSVEPPETSETMNDKTNKRRPSKAKKAEPQEQLVPQTKAKSRSTNKKKPSTSKDSGTDKAMSMNESSATTGENSNGSSSDHSQPKKSGWWKKKVS